MLEVTPDLPLGLGVDPYRARRLDLEAGDRRLIVTDGFLERDGDLAIGDILEHSAERHSREAVRGLARNLLATTGGNLRDDAAILCIDWYGPYGLATPPEAPASIGLRATDRQHRRGVVLSGLGPWCGWG